MGDYKSNDFPFTCYTLLVWYYMKIKVETHYFKSRYFKKPLYYKLFQLSLKNCLYEKVKYLEFNLNF